MKYVAGCSDVNFVYSTACYGFHQNFVCIASARWKFHFVYITAEMWLAYLIFNAL